MRGTPGGHRPGALVTVGLLGVVTGLALTACSTPSTPPATEAPAAAATPTDPPPGRRPRPRPPAVVTLAFAGDVHFEYHLAALPESGGGLGPITRVLAEADVAMVNLESAVTDGGVPERKELEVPWERYHFRTSPAALGFLARSGVDVVSMANNHGADYGATGLRDSLRAARGGPVAVVGIGSDRAAAFRPFRVDVDGTRVAILAADASFREGSSSVWEAGPTNPGVAAARSPRPRTLLRAVRTAARSADVVAVYLHWGEELQACPTPLQRSIARALSRAGADVVVGTHAHVPLAAGWLADTYVGYGLGNFVWYHDQQPETGVLRVRVVDGAVVGGRWVPARIQPDGRPAPVTGPAREAAAEAWEGLRGCAGLAGRP